MSRRFVTFLSLALVLSLVSVTSAIAAPPVQEDQTIVDIAVEDGRFTTLVTALEAADLVETLQGDGPFTVFAPTDDAFAALPEGVLDTLLADPAALTDVLLFHVVSGEVLAEDVVELNSADTVLGEAVTIEVDGSNVMVNNANVIITDIQGSNGVIHVIDAVLVPSAVAAMLEDGEAMAMDDSMAEEDGTMMDEGTMDEEATEEEAPHNLPVTGLALPAATSSTLVLTMAIVVGLSLFVGGVANIRRK